MKRFRLSLLVLAFFLAVPAAADTGLPPHIDVSPPPGLLQRIHDAVAGHLKAGFRPMFVDISDDSRTPADTDGTGRISAEELLSVSFLGSIVRLDARQDYILPSFYAQWAFNERLALELHWEHFHARTFTFSDDYWVGHTDGTFDLGGPMLSAIVRFPNSTFATPSIGMGIAALSSDFDYNPDWRYAGGVVQSLDTTASAGFALVAACEFELDPHWALKLYARWMKASIDAHYYIAFTDGTVFDDRGITRFPMDSTAVGFGMEYRF